MRTARDVTRPWLPGALASLALACLWPSTAWAQAHEQVAGAYTLRASIAHSMSIDEDTARRHGIPWGERRALLNVSLLRTGTQVVSSVPAQVSAEVRNLTGMRRTVELRPVVENGGIAYTAGFPFSNGEVLDVRVLAAPESEPQKRLELAFRDRVWVPR